MCTILEDTRQQAGKHDVKHNGFAELGIDLLRCKLAFGDYCMPPTVAVDTKASIAELAYDIDHDHARFRRELVGARDAGVRLVVLVENTQGVSDLASLARWVESPAEFGKRIYAKRRLEGKRLAKACVTMRARYGCEFLFCAPEEAAGIVSRILLGGEPDGACGSREEVCRAGLGRVAAACQGQGACD